MNGFIDRETETEALRERYTAEEPSLIAVWGRRRVGKSEPIEQSIQDQDDAIQSL